MAKGLPAVEAEGTGGLDLALIDSLQPGDQVLTTVSERLLGTLRASDLVARFGGDEFVVLLSDLESRADIAVVLDALLSVVEVPVKADGRSLSVTPSIGVAVYPEDGRSFNSLLKHAEHHALQELDIVPDVAPTFHRRDGLDLPDDFFLVQALNKAIEQIGRAHV